MDKPHDFARGRKCHNRSYPGEIAVKYAFKMASRYPCHRQRALWSRLVSYQVNIDGGGGGFGFLAAAFSISAFKERIFPHNDGGNNNAAAAAAAPPRGLHIESNPAHRHCATELRRAAAVAVKQCRGLRLLLLLSDDRGCPLAQPTDRVRGAEPDSNLQGEWHAVSTNV